MNPTLHTFPFRYRFWHAIAKRYVNQQEHAILGDGEMLYLEREGSIEDWRWESVRLDLTCIKPEPWTGFVSDIGNPIYLNDIVRFTYQVGDFAWEWMDEVEAKRQTLWSGKPFMGKVTWRLGSFWIDCPTGGELSPTFQFGPIYAGGAEVLGNTNENTDWAKWIPDYSWMRR